MNRNTIMAMVAVLAMFISGAIVIADQSDAIYDTTEYGETYTINLAPGYEYRYTPTFPEGLEVTTIVLKHESDGITAVMDGTMLKVTVNEGVTSGDYDVVLEATSSTGGVNQTAHQHIRIHVVSGLKADEASNYINDIIKGAEVNFQAQASTDATNSKGEPFEITWAVTSGHVLPDGLELSGNTVSGIPTKAGTNTVYLTASSAGQTVDIVVPFKVWQVIVEQEDETIYSHGNEVSSHIIAQTVSDDDTAGDLTLTWDVTSGTIPTGFELDHDTGIITGSSTVLGSTVVTITGTHAASGQSTSKDITINTEPVFTIDASRGTVPVYDGMEDQQVTFSASVTTSTITWSVPTTTGVSIDPLTGVLTVSAGASAGTVTVTATTEYQQTVTKTVTLVSEELMTITGPASVSTSADTPVKKTFQCNVSDVTWSIETVPIGVDVSIDPVTGELTLNDNNPSHNTVTVIATSNTTGQTAEYEVDCLVVAKLVFSDLPTGGVIAYAV